MTTGILPAVAADDVTEIDAHSIDLGRSYSSHVGNPDTRLIIYAQPNEDGSCSFFMYAKDDDDEKKGSWVRAYRCQNAASAIKTLNWLVGWLP